MTRVLIAEVGGTEGRDLSIEQAVLPPDSQIEHLTAAQDETRLIASCRYADVVLVDMAPVTSRVIAEMRKCRLISVAGTGYDNVDLQAAQAAGISVCAVGEYCTEEVADHVLLLILALKRRFNSYQDQVRNKRLWRWEGFTGLARLRDSILGIIGLGKIGRAVARRAHGFGMQILAHDHHPTDHMDFLPGVRLCDLTTLLRQSDVISLNCTLNPESENLINADTLNQMQRKPILINCARGELVDEDALAVALDTGRISAAGLDVLRDEPPDLKTSKLAGRDNVIITPHVAFYSDASILESRRISATNVRNFLDGHHELVDRYVYNHAGQ